MRTTRNKQRQSTWQRCRWTVVHFASEKLFCQCPIDYDEPNNNNFFLVKRHSYFRSHVTDIYFSAVPFCPRYPLYAFCRTATKKSKTKKGAHLHLDNFSLARTFRVLAPPFSDDALNEPRGTSHVPSIRDGLRAAVLPSFLTKNCLAPLLCVHNNDEDPALPRLIYF